MAKGATCAVGTFGGIKPIVSRVGIVNLFYTVTVPRVQSQYAPRGGTPSVRNPAGGSRPSKSKNFSSINIMDLSNIQKPFLK
jgi:hypothetical protein